LNNVVDSERTRKGLKDGMSLKFAAERLTAINKAFVDVLGKGAAQRYLIQDIGKKDGYKQHLITLPEEHIRFINGMGSGYKV
jgi:hypothetical protein